MPARRRVALLLVALLVPLLVVAGCASGGGAGASGPVITAGERWDALPAAQVGGRLTMSGGCLLLGDEVVFWTYGTEWDPAEEAVVFEDGSSVAVGETFEGGGGHYGTDVDFASLLGGDAGRALTECLRTTAAPGVVLAYASAS